jgi:hypothetical protein
VVILRIRRWRLVDGFGARAPTLLSVGGYGGCSGSRWVIRKNGGDCLSTYAASQTRHFRGFPRVDFRRVFLDGPNMSPHPTKAIVEAPEDKGVTTSETPGGPSPRTWARADAVSPKIRRKRFLPARVGAVSRAVPFNATDGALS